MRVARFYCQDAQQTFSLLPDCLCARLSGSLDEAEEAVVASETHGVEASAQGLRVDACELPGVLRWLRRRRRGVHAAILALLTALPGRLGTVAEVRAIRSVLNTERALLALREIGADHLHALPAPVGFRPARGSGAKSEPSVQHETGPDPPAS